jgi:hypothetical protein
MSSSVAKLSVPLRRGVAWETPELLAELDWVPKPQAARAAEAPPPRRASPPTVLTPRKRNVRRSTDSDKGGAFLQ